MRNLAPAKRLPFGATLGDPAETPGAIARVIAFAGQKGGSGKSLFAQSFAVEAARKSNAVVLVDLDIDQRTSFEWAQARLLNKYRPKICAALLDPALDPDFGLGAARQGFDLLVVDAPGWSDERTLRLATLADLMILPATPSVADLRPTIRLAHELKAQGIAGNKIVIVFNQVRADSELSFALAYLREAGLAPLPESLRALLSYRSLQNVGRGITEAGAAAVKKEAKAAMAALSNLLQQTAAPQIEERFKLEPERFAIAASAPNATKRRRRP
ncbi:MAG: CpaE family protein [Methylocella sp.]